jgi:TRAP-type C4-dicarboxylate transport system permease large subunit
MDYLIFIVYYIGKVYKGTKDSSPEFTAVCVVSLIEVLNLILMIGIYAQIFHFYFTPNKLISVIALFVMIILNAFRYNRLLHKVIWLFEIVNLIKLFCCHIKVKYFQMLVIM